MSRPVLVACGMQTVGRMRLGRPLNSISSRWRLDAVATLASLLWAAFATCPCLAQAAPPWTGHECCSCPVTVVTAVHWQGCGGSVLAATADVDRIPTSTVNAVDYLFTATPIDVASARIALARSQSASPPLRILRV
jgi:hypothetical protein